MNNPLYKLAHFLTDRTNVSLASATGPIKTRLTNDVLFHLVFGENTKALKGLLAALLSLDEEDILRIELKDTFDYGLNPGSKKAIMDMKVVLNSSEIINIELQVKRTDDWINRSLYYQSRNFSTESKSGRNYNSLKEVIHIGILDFDLFPDDDEFYSRYMLCNIKRPARIYSNNFKINVLNLRHIDKATQEDIDHHLDEWARLFKAKTWEEVRTLSERNPAIKEASMTMYRMNLVSWLRDFMQARADADYDYHSAISSAEEAGEARGRKEGLSDGENQKAHEVAAAMLSNGEDINKILLYTGISREDLDTLVAKNQ